MCEYSLTEKGLDTITKIIKRSPQYKELVKEFLDFIERLDTLYRKGSPTPPFIQEELRKEKEKLVKMSKDE